MLMVMAQDVLSKGANVSLLHRSAVEESRLQAVIRWSDPDGAADVDVAALLLGHDGQARSDEDFVFYNAPTGGGGAVRLLGKRSQDEFAEDRVSLDLEALPAEVGTVVLVASLDAPDGVGFSDVSDLSLDLFDGAGESRVRFDVPDAGAETAMVLGELYLRGEHWKFRAVGQGWDTGLAGLATDYGIEVAADPLDIVADAGTDAPASTDDTAEADTADIVAVGESGGEPGELPPSVDTDEAGAADVDDARTVGGSPDAVRAPRVRSGVRTRKKRTTAAALPALTLAVDPSWQPARLFSVTGVGNAEEQERRATSTLLSTMMAVRDFGRALVARFGGPAGSIETYLEVPFTLDVRTSIPDVSSGWPEPGGFGPRCWR